MVKYQLQNFKTKEEFFKYLKGIMITKLTFKNVCRASSIGLQLYAFAITFKLAVLLIPPLLFLFLAIIRLPEAAFTNKFLFFSPKNEFCCWIDKMHNSAFIHNYYAISIPFYKII